MATSQKACSELERAFVPALAATLQRYLDSLVAVVSSPAQMEATRRIVHQFEHGGGSNTQDGKGSRDALGPLLQEKLRLFASSRDNWVTELWLDDMYLNNSQPLPVNSSPFYLLPKQCFATSADQARFAARFIECAVLFKKKIDSGTLTPDVQGRGGTRQPLCMQTYKHFFPAYRRPGPTKDDLLLDTASQHQDHVIVVCRDQVPSSVHRKLVSTYESASLRKFYLGRVDNIRAATAQALAWVQAMCDAVPATEEDKIQLFLEAVAKGTEILTYTVNGEGPDNHLLGLREMARLHETPAPIFNDKSYADFLHFRLSTSQLATDKAILVGYGAVVPDGYGCAYNIGADQVSYCVSSFFSSPETSSDFFALSLEGSLLQMRELCLKRATQLNMAPPPARS
ncbi:choline O-acetyltransferase [Dermacentor silvarum]|uniref:choline O-acetyltransferase n=1 Tax=Dermacentor silvarum TaxID=543639 RepID=UPI0018982170|nr:choline O-acetyltransferase [Dermacentor silvarum]